MQKLTHSRYGSCHIHLTDNEWGNDTMERIAREYFESEPSCNFVLVHEHAGWSLGWRRDGTIWSTANDQAVLKPGSTPLAIERVIRRETGSDFWMLNRKVFPALKVVA